MQVFRSPRAIVAAMAAAVMAYAYVAVRGAPAGIGWLAALGESELDARGGIVIDVKLSDPRAADETARAITSRLEAQGASVAIDRTATDHLRVTATGVLPERADAIARTAGMRGQLALRPARDHGPALDALAAVRAPGVANDQDTWSAEDGTWHTVPFLSADDRARLMIAIAKIDASPDEILIETVQPGGDTARGVRFRTYVVAPEVIVGNQDIESADAGADPYNERPVVNLSFGRAAAQRFGDWTAAHVGEKLAIVVDGEVTSAPIINSAIRGGRAVITMGSGGSSRDQWDQARELANALTAGYTFPAPVTAKVIDTRTASIARAHLARFLAAIAAAILALAIAAFLLRWRALAPAPVPCGTGDGAIRWRALAPRLAVTLGVPAGLIVLARAPLPGVSTSDLMPGLTLARVSILSIGVTPVITAYLLVELAALVIPGWRRRRHAGRDARLPLTSATAALGAALTIVQAWFLADYFVAYGFADDRWTIVAALSAGVLAYALGALAIERWGLGNGWSVVIAAPLIEWIARDVTHAALAPLALALAGGALVAMIALGAARTKIDHARLPLGGFVAAAATPALFAFLVGTVTLIPGGGALAFQIVDRLGQPAAQLLSACVLAALLAALWSRRLAGAARTGAIALSTAIALSVASLELASARATGAALGLAFALTAATIADVIVEARARARASWTELASLHDVDHADELLADGSRTARGLHVRALYRFFAPFVPVTIFERTTDDGRRTTISS